MKIAEISAKDTLRLRNEVLRPGRPMSECVFEGDDEVSTRHFGVTDVANDIIGIASVYRKVIPEIARDNSYQLRGMATKSSCRGLGVGRMLLESIEAYVRSRGSTFLWANARSSAVEFYTRHGYSVMSDEFIIDGVGPHYIVVKSLA